nr:MAG TPA: hypothetical protein [Caudoviricetes sp.]
MEMNTITQKLTAISGRLASLTPVSVAGNDTLLTPMGGIRVEGMDDADRILSSPGSDGYRILDGGIYDDVPADGLEAYLDAWAKSMEEAAAARQAVALLGAHIAGGAYECGSTVAVSPHGSVTLTCEGGRHEVAWDVDGRTGTVHHTEALEHALRRLNRPQLAYQLPEAPQPTMEGVTAIDNDERTHVYGHAHAIIRNQLATVVLHDSATAELWEGAVETHPAWCGSIQQYGGAVAARGLGYVEVAGRGTSPLSGGCTTVAGGSVTVSAYKAYRVRVTDYAHASTLLCGQVEAWGKSTAHVEDAFHLWVHEDAAARALDCDSVSQDGGILWCGECDNVKHEGGELTVASGHVETTAPGIVRARTGARITIAHWVRVPRGASELEVGLRGALVPVLCGQARLFLATPRGDGPLPVKEELPEKLLPARLAASCGEAMDLQEMLGDFRLWRVAAPLNALRKVPGGWETTKAIVLEEITGREAIAQ